MGDTLTINQSGMNFYKPFAYQNNSTNFDNLWSKGNSASNSQKTSSNPHKNETYEEMIKRKKAEKEAFITDNELSLYKEEALSKIITEDVKTQLKNNENQIKTIKDNKKSDGSSSSRTKYKDLGFWGKLGRWGANALSAVTNIGKSIVGIDKDGKWHPEIALRNAAIVAGCVALGPIAGAVVSALGATAAVAATTSTIVGGAIAASGIGFGVVTAVRGAENYKSALKTNDETKINNAQQDIITGSITAVLSAFGLRGFSKGLGTGIKNASKTNLKFADKVKVALKETQAGKEARVQAQKITQNGGGFKGYTKTVWQEASQNIKNIMSIKTQYENQLAKVKKALETKKNELNNKVSTLSGAEKDAILKEIAIYESNLNKLQNAKTKFDYEELLRDSKLPKALQSEMEQLVRLKQKQMFKLSANPKKNQAKIDEYLDKSFRDNFKVLYKDRAAIKNRIAEAQAKIEKQMSDIADLRAKLEKTANGRTKASLKRQLTTQEKELEFHLRQKSVLETINYKRWYKMSDWKYRNEYQAGIKTPNWAWKRDTKEFLSLTVGAATSVPVMVTAAGNQCFTPMYSEPSDLNELSKEDTEQIIASIEQYNKVYDSMKTALDSCKTKEEIDTVLAQWAVVQQQAEAQEQGQEDAKS